ncbi:hypothetical protein RCH14_000477 [Massilia sp. MP_M2]|uniref:hypothetical protein n=1 Tax=Massilia sp. MP_M2 TaxID=3071713 RepID=UPI00319DD845
MKLITFEISDRSLAITTVKKAGEQWECVLSASGHADEGAMSAIVQRQIMFDGAHCADMVLEKAIDFSGAFLQLMM